MFTFESDISQVREAQKAAIGIAVSKAHCVPRTVNSNIVDFAAAANGRSDGPHCSMPNSE
jgi:hypothetical protein